MNENISLKSILKQNRIDLDNSIRIYNQLLIDYEETVSKDDYDILADKYQLKLKEFEFLNGKLDNLKNEFDKLKQLNKHVSSQYNEFKNEVHVLQRSSTPRPDWNRCSNVISGGFKRWKLISNGRTSDELVDVILDELNGTYFKPFGLNQIKNRSLNKRDLGLIIKELWHAKINNDVANKKIGQSERDKMSDFCLRYFQKKYNSEYLAHEWYLSLKSACMRFRDYEDAIFLNGVFNDVYDEDIYYYFYALIGRLYTCLEDAQRSEHIMKCSIRSEHSFSKPKKMLSNITNINNEGLSLACFQNALNVTFPYKTKSDIDELIKSCLVDLKDKGHENDKLIQFKHLFMDTDDARFGPFLNTLKAQLENEKLCFIDKIISKLNGVDRVIMTDFIRVLKDLKPDIKETKIQSFCKWVFKKESNEMNQDHILEIGEFVQRLKNGCIYEYY